jgi:tetratricopeptide (TPR) repeat protein
LTQYLLIEKLINSCKVKNVLNDAEIEKTDFYLKLAKGYSETGLYNRAIEILNEIIENNPENKSAYFERAIAYFELGDFDLSLEDYLNSGIKPKPVSSKFPEMISFSLGLTKGAFNGGVEAGVEFIPSMLS